MAISQETWRWLLGSIFVVTITIGGVVVTQANNRMDAQDARLAKIETAAIPTAVATATLEEQIRGLNVNMLRLEQAVTRLADKRE